MRRTLLLLLLLGVVPVQGQQLQHARGMTLRWSDEFNGNSIDAKVWSFDLGDGTDDGAEGWGNNEWQCYTNKNAKIVADPRNDTNRLLSITASYQRGARCWNPQTHTFHKKDWSSARMVTRGKMNFTFDPRYAAIQIAARIKVPMANGTWPGFWLLNSMDGAFSDVPSNSDEGCPYGEIDIMEHVNAAPWFQGTAHYQDKSGSCADDTNEDVPGWLAADPADWHVHAVTWSPTSMSFSLDGRVMWTSSSDSWVWPGPPQPAGGAPFSMPFYMLLNLAVGGDMPLADGLRPSDIDTRPKTLLVDWVRVWDMQQ